MRKISTREKAFLGIGFLAIVGIFVYFLLLPMLQNSNSGPKSNLQEMQEKLDSLEKLGSISPMLVKLEERMKEQSGYKEFIFKQGIADSMIIKYVAQAASQAGINELEQLDPKPDTSKKSPIEARSDQSAAALLVNQLYLVNLMDQMEEPINPTDENKQATNPDSPPKNDNKEENEKADDGGNKAEEGQKKDDPPESEKADESRKNMEQTKLNKILFPVLPKDIPEKARQAMVKSIEASQGKIPAETEIDSILDKAGLTDEEEKVKAKNRLNMYGNRVKEVKNDIQKMISQLGLMKDSSGKKQDRYLVKVVFKSKMDQLVKFLYNLQNSTRWLKIDSMNLSIADNKQAILSIEMSMTANILYE